MIISHRYKYLFVQVPRTASSSIGIELCENYTGEPILFKHATYDDFLEHAGPEEREYFVFAGTRNPLDSIVTEYFRRRAGERTKENRLHQEKFIYIKENNASFPEFVKKFHFHFHKRDKPFCRGADFVYKYENMQDDFSRILDKLDIEQIRPVPQTNRTTGKTDSYLSYYSADIQPMLRIVLRKRMKSAGYEFPAEWRVSFWKRPFLYFTALLKTIGFAAKQRRYHRSRPASPGANDAYTNRLQKTYVNDGNSRVDSNSTSETD